MNKNIKINIPNGAKNIINILQNNCFEAYVVGGCVRDSLLGKKPVDWDITTNALPDETMKLFKTHYRVIPTGLKHGTLTLLREDDSAYEVTTFRIDGEYSDGRHPDEVMFTSSLREDLSRRDFTINAMAYSDKTGLIDYFNGLNDINIRVIRCVGNANERFKEDGLRMMRGIRFSAQLGFDIEKETENAIFQNSALIVKVSIERIQQEFNKIILKDPIRINDLWRLGLLKHFLPEYGLCIGVEQNNPYHIYSIDRHLLESMYHIDKQIALRLTMLLHDVCKPETRSTDVEGIDHFYNHGELSSKNAREILKRMRYDNRTIDRVSELIKFHDTEIIGKKSIRRLLNKIGEENLRDLIKVKEADILAQNPEYYQERHNKLEKIKAELDEVIQEKNCFVIKDLKINGSDLMDIGFKPDKSIGDTLNWLLELVIEKPELNEREKLVNLVKNRGKYSE
ncbi:MAG: poly(A) polymerase [Clostridiales bacterium]|nr:poly(A) polymerase [Clostridiales bacterium]